MKLSTIESEIIGGLMGYTMANMGFNHTTIQFYIVFGLMLAFGLMQAID
jgi:uncharacterized membrane protein YsdA (DUF1294 family)